MKRIRNLPIQTVNELFLLTQPAHLQKLQGRVLDDEARRIAPSQLHPQPAVAELTGAQFQAQPMPWLGPSREHRCSSPRWRRSGSLTWNHYPSWLRGVN